MKKQRTVYVSLANDKSLLEHIGDLKFSPEIIRLAKIGVMLDSMGVTNIIEGLKQAGYNDDVAIIKALELISSREVSVNKKDGRDNPRKPSFIR